VPECGLQPLVPCGNGLDRVEAHGALGTRANSGAGGPLWDPVVANPSVSEFQPPGSRALNVESGDTPDTSMPG